MLLFESRHMTKTLRLSCSALALSFGLLAVPAAYAQDSGDSMSKMSGDAMMHKGSMKKHKKHKDGMMSGDAMKGDAMKKDEAAPAQ